MNWPLIRRFDAMFEWTLQAISLNKSAWGLSVFARFGHRLNVNLTVQDLSILKKMFWEFVSQLLVNLKRPRKILWGLSLDQVYGWLSNKAPKNQQKLSFHLSILRSRTVNLTPSYGSIHKQRRILNFLLEKIETQNFSFNFA
jgi:hypothetical protein